MRHHGGVTAKIGRPLSTADVKALLLRLQVDAAPDDARRQREDKPRSPLTAVMANGEELTRMMEAEFGSSRFGFTRACTP